MKIQCLFLIAGSFLLCCLTGCINHYTHQYSGIHIDDKNGLEGVRNPERGLCLEVALNVESLDNVINPISENGISARLEREAKKYASDSITLVHTYLYSTETTGRPLSEKNLIAIQTSFDKLRELGMIAVLRFAYEREFLGRDKSGPTVEDIRMNTAQLKPFLEKNKDVILVVQAGFIGA